MTTPAVVFPDATATVLTYLRDQLDDRGDTAVLGDEVPYPRPDRFVVVQRVGGPRRDIVVDLPMLTVECWAPTEHEAHDLAAVCRALIGAMRSTVQSGVPIYSVDEVGGLAVLPDPLSDLPRYVFTVQVAMRGTAL